MFTFLPQAQNRVMLEVLNDLEGWLQRNAAGEQEAFETLGKLMSSEPRILALSYLADDPNSWFWEARKVIENGRKLISRFPDRYCFLNSIHLWTFALQFFPDLFLFQFLVNAEQRPRFIISYEDVACAGYVEATQLLGPLTLC